MESVAHSPARLEQVFDYIEARLDQQTDLDETASMSPFTAISPDC
jgi:hypothetical protein